MCVFIYTLPQLCGHKHFQNVAECAGAHGEHEPRPGHRSDSILLDRPKFLFDTAARDNPEFYARHFACRKRKAVRPSPTMCEGCVRQSRRKEEKDEEEAGVRVTELREVMRTPVRKTGGGLVGAAARLMAGPGKGVKSSESTGSEVALISGSASANDVDTSGMFCLFGIERSAEDL